VPYPGRTPHIHFAIKIPKQERFTTQCYIRGLAQNQRDMVLRGIRDDRQRDAVQVDSRRWRIRRSASWRRSSTSCWDSRRRTDRRAFVCYIVRRDDDPHRHHVNAGLGLRFS
jgi:protocatechuate 3,4-dioxygenase beta subunit